MKHYPQKPNARLEALVNKFETQLKDQEKPLFKKSELLLLADYFEFERFPDKALEVINFGISQFTKSPELQVRKTRLLIYNSYLHQAIEMLERKKARGLNPSQRNLLYAEILIVQGKHSEAKSVIAALKFQYSKTRKILSDVFFLDALLYEKMGDFEHSFRALEMALRINPKHKDAKGKLWMSMELSKEFKTGIELSQYLIEQDHYSCMSWFSLAHAYYANFEYKKALEAFEFCIMINEDFESAYIDIAEVCLLLGLYHDASNYLKTVVDKFQIREQDILIMYGESLLRAGEPRASRKILQECKLIDSFDPDVLFLIGETYRVEMNLAAAIRQYHIVLKIESYREDVHRSLGKCYFMQTEFRLAEKHFKKAINCNPEDPDSRTQLASYYFNIGELDSAEHVLTLANEEIDNVKLLYHYSAILMLQDKEEQALKVIGDALQLDFNSHEEVYEFAPELIINKKIEAIINYYSGE